MSLYITDCLSNLEFPQICHLQKSMITEHMLYNNTDILSATNNRIFRAELFKRFKIRVKGNRYPVYLKDGDMFITIRHGEYFLWYVN